MVLTSIPVQYSTEFPNSQKEDDEVCIFRRRFHEEFNADWTESFAAVMQIRNFIEKHRALRYNEKNENNCEVISMGSPCQIRRFRDEDAEAVSALIIHTLRT